MNGQRRVGELEMPELEQEVDNREEIEFYNDHTAVNLIVDGVYAVATPHIFARMLCKIGVRVVS
jgi:hypothetical protein